MKNTLRLLALLITSQLAAQNAEWGPFAKADKRHYAPAILGEDPQYLFSADLKRKTIKLEKFDKESLSREYSKEVELPEKNGKRYDVEKVSFLNGDYILFGSLYDRKTKEFELKAFVIDSETGSYSHEVEVSTSQVEKRRRKGEFTVYTSKNRQSILIHYVTYYKDLDQTVELMKLYDKDLEVLLEREYLQEGEEDPMYSAFIVDDEGSLYFFKGDEIAIMDANAGYEEWSEPIVVEEMERNAIIGRRYMSLDANNDPVIVGSYVTVDYDGEDAKKDLEDADTQVEGMFYMRINGFSKETEVSRLTKFDQDFINEFKTAENEEDGTEAEIENEFNSFNFYFQDNGSVSFVGEALKKTYGQASVEYLYEDLVVYNFTSDGELLWAKRVPKQQRFWVMHTYAYVHVGSYGVSWFLVPDYTGHYSYVAGLSQNKLYLTYNDHPENDGAGFDLSADLEMMHQIKKSVPVAYSLDLETGAVTKEDNHGLIDENTLLKPSVRYQGGQGEPLYIFSIRKKDYRLGRVIFDDNEVASAKDSRKI